MQPWNIAHRGGAQLMPENTLVAFKDALARGCDGAELDVQLTRDGVVVVHHDFRIKAGMARRGGEWLTQPGRVSRTCHCRNCDSSMSARPAGSDYALSHPLLKPATAPVPTLDEVVALAARAGRRFILFVELKCDGSATVPIRKRWRTPPMTGSRRKAFGQCDIRRLRLAGAGAHPSTRATARCWFTTDKLSGDALPVIDAIAAAGGQGWFPHFQDATPEAIAYARAQGLKIGAWTVNAPADMRRLMGLDAICTDRPDLLRYLE